MLRSLLPALIFLLSIDTPAHADLGQNSCPSAAPVVITRVLGERRVEEAELRLTDCFGQPRKQALIELSLLARPHGVPRPSRIDRNAKSVIASSVRRLDPRLLTRLQALATRWPGKRIEIVSGYRPNAKSTSRHRHGRALDLRVVGVDKEEVVAFAKAIPGTGVGYYPNSVFTHIDVRDEATTWVDHSGPGERARYGKFPKNFEALLEDAESSKRAARDAIHNLQNSGLGAPGATPKPTVAAATAPAKDDAKPGIDVATVNAAPNAVDTDREGPSSISEGIDTTSALIAREFAPPKDTAVASAQADADDATDITDDEVSVADIGDDDAVQTETSAIADAGIAELRRQLTQELSTIDTGIDTAPPATPSQDSRAKQAMASHTQSAKTADASTKPIDWSPPW